jgi:hypothetical protein
MNNAQNVYNGVTNFKILFTKGLGGETENYQ